MVFSFLVLLQTLAVSTHPTLSADGGLGAADVAVHELRQDLTKALRRGCLSFGQLKWDRLVRWFRRAVGLLLFALLVGFLDQVKWRLSSQFVDI